MISKIDTIYLKSDVDRICQGDILRDFACESSVLLEGKIRIETVTFPYVVVLSQDCDLERDYINKTEESENQDKYLQSILICTAYLAERLKAGEHLEKLGLKMRYINSDHWDYIETNQNPRYHFLPHDRDLQIPDLTIDFKHYFAVQRDKIYEQISGHYIASINELFREELSQRFAYYLSRIGLPELQRKDEL